MLKAIIERINECNTIGELEFVHDLYKKDLSGTDKVDFMIAWMNRFQELRGVNN